MKKLMFLVLVSVFCLSAGLAQAAVITDVVRRNSTNDPPVIATDLQEDSLCFVDRTHEYNALPLLGIDYVKVANNDKTVATYELDVTLGCSATLYLVIDNRVGGTADTGGLGDWAGVDPDLSSKMTWVTSMGFADTGYDVGIDEGGNGSIDKWSSVFSKDVSAGTITLLEQNDGGSRNMYGVAAVPEPATLALLGFGGLALLRRKR
jgi:hypothetical protein